MVPLLWRRGAHRLRRAALRCCTRPARRPLDLRRRCGTRLLERAVARATKGTEPDRPSAALSDSGETECYSDRQERQTTASFRRGSTEDAAGHQRAESVSITAMASL